MALKEWHRLPVSVRRSRENLYNYFKEELEGGSEEGSPEPVVEPVTRDISITVNNGTNPVQGASVVIGETTKTTGSAGGCTFTGLTDGEHSVTVSADGFTEKTETITVSENNTSFEIVLTSA